VLVLVTVRVNDTIVLVLVARVRVEGMTDTENTLGPTTIVGMTDSVGIMIVVDMKSWMGYFSLLRISTV
jgi:hypothetical protein